jgi:tetratricopeptide (TPR) repeat protein
MPQFSDSNTRTTASAGVISRERDHPAGVKHPTRLLALLWILTASFPSFPAQLSNEHLEEPDPPKLDTQRIRFIMDAYSVALQTPPILPGLNLQFGVRLWELGEIAESKQAFERELNINAGSLRAQLMLAIIKVQQHKYAEAAGELRALIEKDPALTQVWHPLGRALFELGKFEEAKQCLEKAAALDPGVAQVQALLAKTYARLSDTGDAERASALYYDALKLKRARDAAGLGQWPQALQLVSEYLTAFPLSSEGLYVKAGILFNGFRNLDSAVDTVHNSIRQNPSNLEARNLLAALFLAKKDFPAFEQEVNTILLLDPLDGRANYYLGRFEYDRKRLGEAREHLERARLVQPNDPLIGTTLAMTYEGLGLNRQAEAEYKRAIDRGRTGPRDGSLYSNYGAFLLNQSRVAEAVPYLDDAVASSNVRTEVWYMAGIAHLQNGDLAQAKHCLEKALERRRDYAEAHSALGSVLQKEGDTTGALRQFALGKEAEDHAKTGGPKDPVVEDISLPQ